MKAINDRLEWVALYVRGSKPDPEAQHPADEQFRNLAFSCLDELRAISDVLSEALQLTDAVGTALDRQDRKPPERIIDLNG